MLNLKKILDAQGIKKASHYRDALLSNSFVPVAEKYGLSVFAIKKSLGI